MAAKLTALASVMLTLVTSTAGAQGVLTERNISFGMAKTIAESALDACRKDGSRVTVIVLDRTGNIRIVLRDDGAAPHTYENSQRKAYTALTFRAPSRELAERLTKNPGAVAQVYLTGYQRRRWWLAYQSGQRGYRSSGCFWVNICRWQQRPRGHA
jgi:Haem-degrading